MRHKILFSLLAFLAATALTAQVTIPFGDVEELKDSTTLGRNLLKLGNPGAVRFVRINADNSVTLLNASDFLTAIGAGVGGGGNLNADGSVALTGTLPYTTYVVPALVLDVAKFNEKSISAPSTFTLSGTPDLFRPFPATITNTSAGTIAVTLTPPGGYTFKSVERNASLTSFNMSAGATYPLQFTRVSSSVILVTGVPPPLAWPEELQLTHPHYIDGVGAVMNSTTTLPTLGHATFSGTADQAANYAVYRINVPKFFDSSLPIKATLAITLGSSADTGSHRYVLSMASVPAGSPIATATFSLPINIDIAADAGGAIGDREVSTEITLTGWAAALTPGQAFLIKLARDGDDATNDTSNIASNDEVLKLILNYIVQ